jgi:hypothetical protein
MWPTSWTSIEDKTEKDGETLRPAVRGHMRTSSTASRRADPVADIEQGCISSASSILANVAMHLGRTLTWIPPLSKSQATTRPTSPRALRAVGASDCGDGVGAVVRLPWSPV